MLASYATHVINPAMGGAQYDPIADFQPITTLFSFPVMLTVPSALEAEVGAGAGRARQDASRAA